jgi:hypothetical protein
VVVADNLRKLPPRVVYTHSGTSEAVPVFFKGHHGAPFGHLLLAGHGVNVEEAELKERMEKEKPLPCPRCKARGPRRPGEKAADEDPDTGTGGRS